MILNEEVLPGFYYFKGKKLIMSQYMRHETDLFEQRLFCFDF